MEDYGKMHFFVIISKNDKLKRNWMFLYIIEYSSPWMAYPVMWFHNKQDKSSLIRQCLQKNPLIPCNFYMPKKMFIKKFLLIFFF